MLRGNAIVGQSGGPTSVINTSLAGIIAKAKECEGIHNVFGMRYGIEGFMAENIINLSDQPTSILEGLKTTPSSALGSCRHKLQEAD
ncbi:MAG: 6-phosphofructokinase [Planctomycetota bacterium]